MNKFQKTLLCGSPAMVVLLVIAGISGRALWKQDTIRVMYRDLAKEAMQQGEFDAAKTYYSRLFTFREQMDLDAQFNWAILLAQGGDARAASAAFDRLAPDDAVGFAPAHRIKAIGIASAIQQGSGFDSQLLEQLKKHIHRSGSENELEVQKLWLTYHVSAGDVKAALDNMHRIATAEPTFWNEAAKLAGQLGDSKAQSKYLDNAADFLRSKIIESPLDPINRLELSKILIYQKKVTEAETLLSDGIKLQADADLTRTLSDLYLLRFAQNRSDASNAHADNLRWVMRALEVDPANQNVYFAMLELYRRDSDKTYRHELITSLNQLIAQGTSSAFAHFVLGAIAFIDGDTQNARWHTDLAHQLAPDFSEVSNNLAWILSVSDQPDLERALALVESAIMANPNNLNYRDTRGSILVRMHRYQDALVDFERILPQRTGDEKKAVHRKLAYIYTRLNKTDIAAEHRRLADEKHSSGPAAR